MANEWKLNQLCVDNKGLSEITGFCRQRVSDFRNDPALGFPEPVVIGRSIRWLVCDILEWLQSMKRSNAELLDSLVSKKVAVNIKQSKKAVQPAPNRRSLLLQKPHKHTEAEIVAENKRVLAAPLTKGQFLYRTQVVTQEGTSMLSYRMMKGGTSLERVSPMISVPIRRKVTFAPGTPPDVQQRYLASRASLVAARTVAESTAKEPVHLPVADIPVKEISLVDLKKQYEIGKSLDALCKQYGMGKSRLSKLLRESGAQMRQAGRQPRKSI